MDKRFLRHKSISSTIEVENKAESKHRQKALSHLRHQYDGLADLSEYTTGLKMNQWSYLNCD